jgi:UDPglucose 6-dehydrogenase
MINVGIIGCGFVGGALKDWLEHNNPECKLFISDPAKGYHDDLSPIDIAFCERRAEWILEVKKKKRDG